MECTELTASRSRAGQGRSRFDASTATKRGKHQTSSRWGGTSSATFLRAINQYQHRLITHGKEDIAKVHENENEDANSCKVHKVAHGHQGDGDDVVTEHLPVIVPALFQVENQ